MSGEKRPASESFNPTTQLVVKRQKSNSDLKSNAVTLRSGQNGTLVQTVRSISIFSERLLILERRFLEQAVSQLQSWN